MLKYPKISIIFILLLFYYLSSILMPPEIEGTNIGNDANRIYSQISMGLIYFYCSYYTILHRRTLISITYFKLFIIYFILLLFYLPFTNGEFLISDNLIFYMKITTSVVFMSCVYIAICHTPKSIKILYYIFFVQVFYSCVILVRDYYFLKIVMVTGTNTVMSSNAGFLMASLTPMCFLLPWHRLKIYLYLVIFLLTLVGGQRAAALGVAISLPFAYMSFKERMKRFDWLLLIILIIIAIPLFTIALDNFIDRIQIDEKSDSIGSGRSEFWGVIIESLISGNIINLIIGNGYFSVNSLLEIKYGMAIGAHNGFLDHIFSFGVIGFIIYLSCIMSFYFFYKKIKRCKFEYRQVPLVMFLILFLRSVTSHGFFEIAYMPFFMAYSLLIYMYKHNYSSQSENYEYKRVFKS